VIALHRGRTGIVLVLALALALPTVASASDGTSQTPTTSSCTGSGCQRTQDPTGAAPTATTGLTSSQGENSGQAGYALYGLLLFLLISVPVAATWQRTVREKASSADDDPARPRRT
jgi:hypothetical protein